MFDYKNKKNLNYNDIIECLRVIIEDLKIDKNLPEKDRYNLIHEEFVLRLYEPLKDEEKKIIPTIELIAHSPKKYIKQYKVGIVSKLIDRQLLINENIIKETLLKDLAIHNGLKVNTYMLVQLTRIRKND